MGRNLTDLFISESFNYLMQVSGSNVQNGLGASLSGSVLDLHVVSASYAVSASHEIIKEVSSSYADFAQVAGIATSSLSADSVAFANITGKPTLVSGSSQITLQDTSGDLSGSRIIGAVANATNTRYVNVQPNAINSNYFPSFTNGTGENTTIYIDLTGYTYNPSNNKLTVGNISATTLSGSLFGNATTATSASHALVADTVTGTVTNATYAQNTIITGKNLEATEIAKGTPLYFTGSGTSGNLVGILRADAGNPARMPAGGIAGEAIASGAEGVVLLDGFINGVDTSAFASGDEVFVGVGGGYTNVAPTGSANLVQKLGNVEKSAVNGSGVINGPGAVRSVPNIAQNNLWVGDANGVAQAVNQNTLSVKQAVSSSRAYVNVSAANVDYHVTFNTVNAGYKELLQETEGSQFTYNPSNNKLTVANISATTLSGSLFGNATTATTASHVTEAVVAKTDKNNSFTGTQTFNNINVNGTGSFAYIQSVTGSAKIIGDAYIILNNDTPTQRYAGIVVQDSGSGSPLTTASLEFDGQTNDWFYEYSNDGGVTTDHGVALFGPAYSSKGSPTYLTTNAIPKSSGSHHLADSNISDNGSTIALGTNTTVTGYVEQNFTAPGTNEEKAFFNVSGAQVNGKNYNRVFYGIADYPSFGNQFEDYFAVEYYDGLSYNFGSEFNVNGKQTQLYTKASGSGQESYVRTTDNYNGTSQVSIGSGNKVVLNGKTEITGSTEIRLTGAESLKAFKPGSGTFSTTGGDITATFGSTQVAVATPYGGTLGVKNTSTGDDFGLAADMSQWGFLGDWTGPGIFANDPSDNYPTIIGFQNKSSWTDGRVTVLTPLYVTSSNGFPLYVDGTMNTKRIHFDKNPFNSTPSDNLGAIRLDGSNTQFYTTLYNSTYEIASQSAFLLYNDTGSLTTYSEMHSDWGGANAKFRLTNVNGTRTGELDVDTLHVTGSASFQSTITGSISTAYNNNTSSGSIGFWQGSQAEYNLISGSASNSIIYFVV